MFLGRELEHEVGREPFLVALNLLVKMLDRHAIELSQVSVKDDPVATQEQDSRLDGKDRSSTLWHREQFCLFWFLHFEVTNCDVKIIT